MGIKASLWDIAHKLISMGINTKAKNNLYETALLIVQDEIENLKNKLPKDDQSEDLGYSEEERRNIEKHHNAITERLDALQSIKSILQEKDAIGATPTEDGN